MENEMEINKVKATKKTIDIEAEAIATIFNAVSGLADDRKLAVLSFVVGRVKGKEFEPTGNLGIDAGHGGETIKAFLKRKNPQNKYQQVAVLAYFLKKEGQEEINKESIDAANKNAGGRTIDDITATLNDAKSKYGYFGAGTGGKKILLAFGEDIVDALPNQEEVKKLSKRNPRKSKKAKTRRSK